MEGGIPLASLFMKCGCLRLGSNERNAPGMVIARRVETWCNVLGGKLTRVFTRSDSLEKD